MGSMKWEQVYRWILAYIDEKKFSGNLRLPSENALCRRFEVSRETVRYAMEELEREGLIYKVRGSGTYFNKEVALSRELDSGAAQCKIGLILQGQDSSANSDLIKGIKSVLPPDQVDLRIFLTNNKFANERRCLQTVSHQNFKGFIVDGVKASIHNPNVDCYRELYRKGIPVIFYNNYYKNLRYPKVIINDLVCADQLLSLLFRAGHRHIAGIFVYDNYQSVEKFQGMFATFQKYGVEFEDDYIKWCISDEAHDESYARSIAKFLKGLPKCTAIVCCNYIIYRLVRQVLEMQGKRVPGDYSLVCFDYSEDGWEQEGITCSKPQGYQIGSQAASRLMKMINRNDWDSRDYSIMLRPEIYIGSSIRQLPSKAHRV